MWPPVYDGVEHSVDEGKQLGRLGEVKERTVHVELKCSDVQCSAEKRSAIITEQGM